jgi:glycyl-tRNA synthetase beta chain
VSLPFLFEIGVEEIPDWMIEDSLGDLREAFEETLSANRLSGAVTAVDATPRRLALQAVGLPENQPGEVREVQGPPLSAGAGAAQGFAKKMGVALESLGTAETPKGRYYSYRQEVPGRPTAEILADALPNIIGAIHFPKTMYWTGKGGPRFIRPVRWIVALLGPNVVPFGFADVRSSDRTDGHRILGRKALPVTTETYERVLRDNGVLLSASERRARILAGLDNGVQIDENLVNTLVYLTEMPTPIRGSFDPAFLELPREILSTVMRHHQRYFSVAGENGKLRPEFVAVMNTGADPEGLVRQGNERVLRARFNDARFFWDVDLRRRLSDRLEDLRAVTFQAKLGSYHEKAVRMRGLAHSIAVAAEADPQLCIDACDLAKCDLTTEMVKEFPELQGVVGGLYAREQGERTEVWRAVYEHYKPVSMEDSIPSTRTGQVVALTDKLDTLRGCFAIGLVPTGSKDPFALRRAAQGVIKIVVEGQLPLRLAELTGGDAQLIEFMVDRLRYYFREVLGFPYDEVNAVLAAGSDEPLDANRRLQAIRQVRPTPDLEPLAASFKRIQNILRQAQFGGSGTVDPALLEAGPETELFEQFTRLRETVQVQRRAANYQQALAAIASIRPQVDRFFDKVLVNAPDATVRHNRLLLLSSLLSEFSTIAVFSEIVVASQ